MSKAAAKHGHIQVLQWTHERGCVGEKAFPEPCLFAACGGHLETLKWLMENGFDLGIVASNSCRPLIDEAVKNDRVDVVCWFLAVEGRQFLHRSDRESAMVCCTVDTAKWLCGHHIGLSNICERAAEYGKVDILKWAFENFEPEIDENMVRQAICGGQFEIMKWFDEMGFDGWQKLRVYKCISEDIDVFKWLDAKGCQFRSRMSGWYAYADNECLEVLQFLHDKGFILEDACLLAARNQQLHILAWADSINELPWHIVHQAVMPHSTATLEWLKEAHPDWIEKFVVALCKSRNTFLEENLVVFEWFLKQGVKLDVGRIRELEKSKFVEMQIWARKHRHLVSEM